MARTPETLSDDEFYLSEDENALRPIWECEELSHITYSREATVAAFQDYYDFLTAMYMDYDAVIKPPETGWPGITTECLQGLGKSDEVVALLRHLPYVKSLPDSKQTCVAPHCSFYDFATETNWDQAIAMQTVATGEDNILPHVIALGSYRYSDILLDTQLGVIYYAECPFTTDPDLPIRPIQEDMHSYFPPREAEWRDCGWAIADFFEVLKYMFRKLRFIPLSRLIVEGAGFEDGFPEAAGAELMVKGFFHQHGWPDLERYQKQKCIEAVEKAVEEEYPDCFFP